MNTTPEQDQNVQGTFQNLVQIEDGDVLRDVAGNVRVAVEFRDRENLVLDWYQAQEFTVEVVERNGMRIDQ